MSQENSYDLLHSLPKIKNNDDLDRKEGKTVVVTPEELPVATPEKARKTTEEIKQVKGITEKGITEKGKNNITVENIQVDNLVKEGSSLEETTNEDNER